MQPRPRRGGWVEHPRNWPHFGAIVPGCPWLHPFSESFWPDFWKMDVRDREAGGGESDDP